jgi:hypothetical protein
VLRGLRVNALEAGEERGFDQAFTPALRRRVSAVIVTSDALFAALGTLGLRHRMPTIFTYRAFVAAGGLAGYSGSLTDTAHIWRLCGLHFEGGNASGSAGTAIDQGSDDHQRQGRASARDHGATVGVGAR